MFANRKGITPVIAIVLLLLITVGAVGVVYTQFQSLTGDPTEELDQQERLRSADYTITAVRSTDTGTPSNGQIQITIKNTGDALWNLSDSMEVQVGPDGNSPSVVTAYAGTSYEYSSISSDFTCKDPSTIGNKGILEIGQSYTCDTGISFPETSWDTTKIELILGGVTQATASCKVRDSNTFTC